MVPHLIDGQDAAADHLGLGGDEGGHHQTRAVTEAQARLHKQSLHTKQTNKQTKHTHTEQRSRVNQQTKQYLRTGEGFSLECTAYLKVLGVTGSCRNRHLFVPEDGVDGCTFAHVGIANLFNTFYDTF